MQEIELTHEFNSAVEFYEQLYQKKHHCKPTYPNDAGKIKLRQLMRSLGAARVNELLEHFFKMTDPYFSKRGHSLEVFHYEIAAITASRGSVSRKEENSKASSDLRMSWRTWCKNTNCKEEWNIIGTLDELLHQHGNLFCKTHSGWQNQPKLLIVTRWLLLTKASTDWLLASSGH